MGSEKSSPAENPALQVLVVDDELNIRKTLSVCLETEGHSVTAVSNVKDARAEASRRPFDLAFVDLRLGTDDGLDLIPSLLAAVPWLKVIVNTAYASIDTAVEAMRRGASDYIPKPFTPAQIKMALRSVRITDPGAEAGGARGGHRPGTTGYRFLDGGPSDAASRGPGPPGDDDGRDPAPSRRKRDRQDHAGPVFPAVRGQARPADAGAAAAAPGIPERYLLSRWLSPKRILIWDRPVTKEEALRSLAATAANGAGIVDVDSLFNEIMSREEEGRPKPAFFSSDSARPARPRKCWPR